MRGRRVRGVILFAIWLVVYVVGLAAGLKVISFMPGEWKKDNLEYYAKQRMIEYSSNGRVSNWSNACIATIIYDENGNFKDFFRMDGKPFQLNFLDESTPDVSKVLKGEKTLRLVPLVGNYSKLRYTSLIYVGIPMVDKETGRITGAFFWIKDCPDMLETMIGYVLVFTAMSILIVIIFALSLRRERKIMQIPKKYVDNITHELKSPIAAIKGLTEALSDGMAKDEDETLVYYGMILKEANRQEKMIKDVLELSRLQNVPDAITKEKVAGETIFKQMSETLFLRCDLSGIEFMVTDAVKELPELYTNEAAVQQVVNILVNNSIKFVEEGGHITIDARVQGKKAYITVADEGKGISEQDIPHIFDRFYKANRSDNEKGSGLGLAIARETMLSMKEKIWVESKEGDGAKFIFTLTVA